jgi:hypothetical protein
MQSNVKKSLSNAQLELLKTFNHQLSENELNDFKNTIAAFFSKRLIKEANKTWDDKKWDDKKVDELLATKLRKK